MDDFEDIDSLIDLEDDLHEDPGAGIGQKRPASSLSREDAPSQLGLKPEKQENPVKLRNAAADQDVYHHIYETKDENAKRIRKDGENIDHVVGNGRELLIGRRKGSDGQAGTQEVDDDELLRIIAKMPLSQTEGYDINEMDEDELLEMVGRMPFSQSQLDESQATGKGLSGEAACVVGKHKDSQADNKGCSTEESPSNKNKTLEEEHRDLDSLEGVEIPMEEEEGGGNGVIEQTNCQRDRSDTIDTILPVREFIPPYRDAIHVTGAFITVTASNGERVYAPISDSARPQSAVDIAGSLRRARGSLLSANIECLMEEIEKVQFDRALAESAAEASAKRAREETGGSDSVDQMINNGDNQNNLRNMQKTRVEENKKKNSIHLNKEINASKSLWVDKYAPRTFLDLLSDERVNRDVVRWLKSWDPCVFNRPAPENNWSNKFQPRINSQGSKRYTEKGKIDKKTMEDPFGRPEHKVILLSGGPGLGKTTLAHVVAAHCGYRPVEINASDDRNSSNLLKRVVDAVEMKSVVSGDNRPNCLILDEIDGAAGGAEGRSAVLALVKVITATSTRSNGDKDKTKSKNRSNERESDSSEEEEHHASNNTRRDNHKRKTSKSSRKRLRPLMRPIICICNDLYAPALRPLREIAQIFQFRRPSAERLAHRLSTICAAEGLQVEKSTLRILVERSECDMRSCLNTLQFLSKKQQVIKYIDVSKIGLGQKDQNKGAFQVWTELLQRKRTTGLIGGISENDAQRSSRLYDTLLDFGESDLVLNGILESLPSLKYFDMALSRTSQILNFLQDADILLQATSFGGKGDAAMYKYFPAAVLLATGPISSNERPRVTWPRSMTEVNRRHKSNKSILQQWLLSMSASNFASLGPTSAAHDVLPMLPFITSPILRPVSLHLYTKQESEVARKLIDSLLCLGLTYSLQSEDELISQIDEDDLIFRAARDSGNILLNTLNQKSGSREIHSLRMNAPTTELELQFKPPIHRLWSFKGSNAARENKKRSLLMAVRQTLAHELAMEAIRRSDISRQHRGTAVFTNSSDSKANVLTDTEIKNQSYKVAKGSQGADAKTSLVPLDLAQRLEQAGVRGKGASSSSVPARKINWLESLRANHFKQNRSGAKSGRQENGGAKPNTEHPVLYKFHEGYTNAVKRPVIMSELL